MEIAETKTDPWKISHVKENDYIPKHTPCCRMLTWYQNRTAKSEIVK